MNIEKTVTTADGRADIVTSNHVETAAPGAKAAE
jgi:hypothetical protein